MLPGWLLVELLHLVQAKVLCSGLTLLQRVCNLQGTYDVNVLVAGRGITGTAAFKATKANK